MNNFIVLYSGGMGSFLATYLLKLQNPGAKILLYFNDTKYEDPDLYRFLKETVDWLKLPLLDDSDGRSVWELFEDREFVGNSRVDICSEVLKRDRSNFFIKKNFKPDEIKIVLGIDWTEIHRLENAKPHWEPYKLIAPLCDYKGDKKDLEKIVLAESGIKRPKLYDLGFAHNNCFAGETEFITDQGIKTLKEMVGLPLKVLGKHQAWEAAEVKSFGEQQLYLLTVSRSNETKMIYTTLDHKWFRRKGVRGRETELVTTEQLLPGNRLVSNYAKRLNSQIEVSAFGKSTGEEVMPQTWKVVSIDETDRFEEVYCAVVPGSHSFTLESNLLTSNCGGRCVKQGLAGFRLLYEKMPERYLEMEEQQEETKRKCPRTKPFLKKQVNGVTYYLSLKDYREQYLLDITHQPTFDEQYDFGGCACAL